MTMKSLALACALLVAPVAAGADLEQEAREIERRLIAPCCFSQQVSVHQSGAADDARRDIRARLATGQTREQILDAYVSQYGKRVLAEPPAEGFDLTLHLMPVALLLAGTGIVIAVIRRFTSGRGIPAALAPAAAGPAAADVSRHAVDGTDLERRLDDELRDLD